MRWAAVVTLWYMLLEIAVGDLLRATTSQIPDAVALVSAGAGERRQWTYAELLEQSEQAARALLGRFSPGERVAIWSNNIAEWVILELAAGLAGITIVTVDPSLRADELKYVLGQSRTQGIFLIPEYRGLAMAEMLDKVRPELPELREVISFDDWEAFCSSGSPTEHLATVDPRSPAQIQYTSGTTGRPKGALLHHRGIVNNARLCMERLCAEPGMVYLSPMPLFHTAGCVMGVLGTIASAGTLVLPPFFAPEMLLGLIESEHATCLCAAPTMLLACLDSPQFAATDVSTLRLVLTGGAVVTPALARRAEEAFGARVSILFAQTEASPVITQTSPHDEAEERWTTVGRPLPHSEVKIVDLATGKTAGPHVVGEICTRGYHVMTGYFGNPDATTAAIDTDGWLYTGDLASVDDRGYYKIAGRLKDVIIRGGENISPREIEQLLIEHPSVTDVAVIGIPDPLWGEQVAAFIRSVPGHPFEPEMLRAYCREQLAPHKTPHHWIEVDRFPRTPSGKVKKFVLREQFLADGDVSEAR
jgi:acyl-CoA synthetase (AMP-forming)/AMP-acid ligase II